MLIAGCRGRAEPPTEPEEPYRSTPVGPSVDAGYGEPDEPRESTPPGPTSEREAPSELEVPAPEPAPAATSCCQICRKGKACGNTCIAEDRTCHVVRGCACDG